MKKTISVLMIVLAVAAGILVSRIEDKTGDNSTTITNVNCSELGKNIFFTIDLMQFCEEDSECIIDKNHHLSCPFGCYLIRSKIFNDEEGLLFLDERINQFIDNCPQCEYECPIEPTNDDIVCLNNRCVDIRFQNSENNALGTGDWDWDTGQNCNGLTIPEQCEPIVALARGRPLTLPI